MSIHLEAKPGEIAPSVLLPGDPLRAKWIATNFLETSDSLVTRKKTSAEERESSFRHMIELALGVLVP